MINSDTMAELIRLEKRIEALEKLTKPLFSQNSGRDLQICGHPKSAIVSSKGGTSYCAECEREGRGADGTYIKG